MKYVDPCGVHHRGFGVVNVTDGAIPFSADAEVRIVSTLTRPNATRCEIDLEGKNGSWVLLLTPLMRAPGILIFNDISSEIDNRIQVKFCTAWAQSGAFADRDSVAFPNWQLFDDDEETGKSYYCVVQSSALSKVLPPNE